MCAGKGAGFTQAIRSRRQQAPDARPPNPQGLNGLDHSLDGVDFQKDRFTRQEGLVEKFDLSRLGPINSFRAHGHTNYRSFQRTVSLRP